MALWWLCGVFQVVVKPEILIYPFKVKFDLEGQGYLPLERIEIMTNVFCTSGSNLVTLASTGDELWCEQAQNGVNLDFKLNLTLNVKIHLSTKQ